MKAAGWPIRDISTTTRVSGSARKANRGVTVSGLPMPCGTTALRPATRIWPRNCCPALIVNYREWENTHRDPNGLYWQIDGRDGMEVSIGKSGYRATINSYMYGDAMAIARIAELAGKPDEAAAYRQRAAKIKQLVQDKLWDPHAEFFKVSPRGETIQLADVRELHGLTPWYFGLPRSVVLRGLEAVDGSARLLCTPRPDHGRTTPSPNSASPTRGTSVQWNGPSWPYATSITLVAMANPVEQLPARHRQPQGLLRRAVDLHEVTPPETRRRTRRAVDRRESQSTNGRLDFSHAAEGMAQRHLGPAQRRCRARQGLQSFHLL